MPTRKRKVRKKRGSRTYGYGRVGQHRSHGSKGGTGKTGYRKHKWSYVVSHEKDYFDKKGFTSIKNYEKNTINVGELEQQVDALLNEKKAEKIDDGIHIDLNSLGFEKLLGKGKVTKPLIIEVAEYSKSAKEKIEHAKGKILDNNK
jgi:large subunit ribosomal protein L15